MVSRVRYKNPQQSTGSLFHFCHREGVTAVLSSCRRAPLSYRGGWPLLTNIRAESGERKKCLPTQSFVTKQMYSYLIVHVNNTCIRASMKSLILAQTNRAILKQATFSIHAVVLEVPKKWVLCLGLLCRRPVLFLRAASVVLLL